MSYAGTLEQEGAAMVVDVRCGEIAARLAIVSMDFYCRIASVGVVVIATHMTFRAQLNAARVTGDPLTDDFLALVAEARRHKTNEYYKRIKQCIDPHWKPDHFPLVERVLEWEPRYRDDPRFWQLVVYARYVANDYDHREICEIGVKEQIIRGIVSPESMTILLRNPRSAGTEEDIQQQLDYCIQVVEQYPENAYFRYYLGTYYLQIGEVEMAWEQFRLCNTATDTTYPRKFPVSSILEHHDSFNTPDNQLIAAWIVANESYENYIFRKEDEKCVETCLTLGMPVEFGDEFYNTLITRGLLSGQESIGSWVYAVIVNEYISYCHDELFVLDQDQQDEYDELQNVLQTIQDDYAQRSSQLEYSIATVVQFALPDALDELGKLTVQQGQDNFRRIVLKEQYADNCRVALQTAQCRPLSAWENGGLIGFDPPENIELGYGLTEVQESEREK